MILRRIQRSWKGRVAILCVSHTSFLFRFTESHCQSAKSELVRPAICLRVPTLQGLEKTGKSSENGIFCSLVLNMIRHNNSTNLNFNFFFGVRFYDSDGAQGGKHTQKVLCQIINLPFDRDIRPRGRKQQHQNISILFSNLMIINAEILSFQCSLVI